MCVFSGPVESVTDTSIFARHLGDGRQLLAYGMSYAAAAELAMVLPLPVPRGSAEDAVRFVSLERYPEFFGDLHQLFQPQFDDEGLSASEAEEAAPRLPVHDVGSFEASFVPSPGHFSRLDERFRLPPGLWELTSVALALSLPAGVHRDVVVFSIVAQGLTLARVLRQRRAQPSKPSRP